MRWVEAFTKGVFLAAGFPNQQSVPRLVFRAVGIWEERAGRNEALFREVNENIAKLEARLGSGEQGMPAICECALPDCTEQIEISMDDYVRVRRNPDWFIVAPGHDEPSVEQVVETHAGYVVVEKQGVAAAAADAVS